MRQTGALELAKRGWMNLFWLARRILKNLSLVSKRLRRYPPKIRILYLNFTLKILLKMASIREKMFALEERASLVVIGLSNDTISWADAADEEDEIMRIRNELTDEMMTAGPEESVVESVASEPSAVDSVPKEKSAEQQSLILRNLPINVTEEEVRSLFIGEVENIKIPLDRTTMRTRGFAFVTCMGYPIVPVRGRMKNVVYENCDGRKTDGVKRKTDVKESDTLVLRNLPLGVTVVGVMALVGNGFQRITVPRDGTGKTRGFAFVKFNSVKEAAAAMTRIMGGRIVVEFAVGGQK